MSGSIDAKFAAGRAKMAEKPVTSADREAAIMARIEAERQANGVNGTAHADDGLPPQPFDAQAGWRAWRKFIANPAGGFGADQEPKGVIVPTRLAGQRAHPAVDGTSRRR